jgi:hypothetical protein
MLLGVQNSVIEQDTRYGGASQGKSHRMKRLDTADIDWRVTNKFSRLAIG